MAAKKSIDKRKVLEAAQKHWNKRNYDKALVEYQTLLEADPKDVNVRFKVGECFLRLGKQSEASAAYIKVAQDYAKQGFDAKAVAVYKQVLNLDSKNADVQVALADLYQRLGLNSDAMNALQIAADVYNKEGKKDNAIELLRKMASLDPTNTTNRLKVADILRHAGRRDDALTEYEEVLNELERQGEVERMLAVGDQIFALDASRADILARMARLMQGRRENEQAKELMKRACAADPRNIEYFEALAELYTKLGKDKERQEAYKEVAKLYRERGDKDRAQEVLQKHVNMELGVDINELSASGIDLNEMSGSGIASNVDPNELSGSGFNIDPFAPTDVAIGTDSGSLDFEIGGDSGEIGSVLTDDEMFGDRNDTSMSAALGGSFPDVSSEETEVVVGDPEQVLAEASVYLRYNKHEKAITSLKALLKVEPEHRGALEMLGDAFLALGDKKGALQVWSKAAVLAKAANDTVVFDILKDRIAAVDAAFAASLDTSLHKSESSAVSAPPPTKTAAPDASFDFGGSDGFVDFDGAIDLDDSAAFAERKEGSDVMFASDEITFEIESADSAPAVPEMETGAGAEIEVEIDDIDLGVAVAQTPPVAAQAEAAPVAPPSTPIGVEEEFALVDEPQVGESTASDVESPEEDTAGVAAQGDDDLGTADFYFEQEMYAEAKDLYTKVLERTPNHPKALLKLGEIEDALRESAPHDAGVDIAVDVDVDVEMEVEGSGAMVAAPPAPSVDAIASGDSLSGIESTAFAPEIEISVDDDFATSLAMGVDTQIEAETAPSFVEAAESVPAPRAASAAATTQVDLEEVQVPLESSAPAFEAPTPTFDKPTPSFVEPVAPPPASVASAAASEKFESFTDLIEEEKPPVPPAPAEGEADFDLADALSEALAGDPSASSGSAGTGDVGFEEVFKAFKKGVSETVSEGDYETHYDLGIAYKEMGLYEDALGEFKISLESVARQGASLHMLGLCSIELGRHENAIAYLGDALLLPKVDSALQAALQYDMGRAFESMQNTVGARACYEACAAIDPQFQDVSERLVNLDNPPSSDDDSQSGIEPVQTDAGFENFDDFMMEAPDAETAEEMVEAAEEATPAATFESFDDFIEEAQAEVQADVIDAAEEATVVEAEDVEAVEEVALVDEAVEDLSVEEVVSEGVMALDEEVAVEAEPVAQEAAPTVSVTSKKAPATSAPVAAKAQDKTGKKKKKISYI